MTGTERILRQRPLGPMDERWFPEPGQAQLIQNMTRRADGAWVTSGGFNPIGGGFAGFGRILSVHWFDQHQGGRQWLVFEHETVANPGVASLAFYNFSATAAVPIVSLILVGLSAIALVVVLGVLVHNVGLDTFMIPKFWGESAPSN